MRGNERSVLVGVAWSSAHPRAISCSEWALCGTSSIPLIPAKAGIQNYSPALPWSRGFPLTREWAECVWSALP